MLANWTREVTTQGTVTLHLFAEQDDWQLSAKDCHGFIPCLVRSFGLLSTVVSRCCKRQCHQPDYLKHDVFISRMLLQQNQALAMVRATQRGVLCARLSSHLQHCKVELIWKRASQAAPDRKEAHECVYRVQL